MAHLESLRLEGLEAVPAARLRGHAARWGRPKLHRAVEAILMLKERE